mmetsp:Transcript_3714/g.12754  ORF Transcript_3714/g.12754 Transcript_3714/m.12754 type:complete len:302 (-) Transcript_3714:1471-2376(-)
MYEHGVVPRRARAVRAVRAPELGDDRLDEALLHHERHGEVVELIEPASRERPRLRLERVQFALHLRVFLGYLEQIPLHLLERRAHRRELSLFRDLTVPVIDEPVPPRLIEAVHGVERRVERLHRRQPRLWLPARHRPAERGVEGVVLRVADDLMRGVVALAAPARERAAGEMEPRVRELLRGRLQVYRRPRRPLRRVVRVRGEGEPPRCRAQARPREGLLRGAPAGCAVRVDSARGSFAAPVQTPERVEQEIRLRERGFKDARELVILRDDFLVPLLALVHALGERGHHRGALDFLRRELL